MNSKVLRIFLSSLLLITILSYSSTISYATRATASVTPSKSTVNVGDTVTVTMTFSAANIGAVQGNFTFNTDILQYVSSQVNQFSVVNVSGGTGTLVLLDPHGASAITVTSTFKALKTGTVDFRVSGEVGVIDGNTLVGVSARTTITVATPPPPPPPRPSQPTQPTQPSRPTTPPPPREPEPKPRNPVEDAIKLTLNEEELFMWVELSTVKLPDGFKITTVEYNGEDVEMAMSEKSGLILAYLTDEEGKNGRFFVFDSNNKLYPYLTFNSLNTHTILRADSSVAIPEGYMEVELSINDFIVQAWQKESGDNPDFYLIYALNSEGETGLYYFDSAENTLQRFFDKTVFVEVEIEPEEQTFFQKLFGDRAIMGIVVTLTVLNLSLLGLATALLNKIKNLKKRKPYTPTI